VFEEDRLWDRQAKCVGIRLITFTFFDAAVFSGIGHEFPKVRPAQIKAGQTAERQFFSPK
jgi:hypothetical protein